MDHARIREILKRSLYRELRMIFVNVHAKSSRLVLRPSISGAFVSPYSSILKDILGILAAYQLQSPHIISHFPDEYQRHQSHFPDESSPYSSHFPDESF